MSSSIITNNSNWDILPEVLVTFKKCDGVKNKKFEYYEGSLKTPIFRDGDSWKTNIWGRVTKNREARTVFRSEGRAWGEREVVFLRGVDTPINTMIHFYCKNEGISIVLLIKLHAVCAVSLKSIR